MKYMLLTVAFLCLFASPSLAIEDDKVLHLGFSAVAGSVAETVIIAHSPKANPWKRIALGTTMGTLPGLLKEIADSGEEGNKFDNEDLAYDIVGAFAGALFIETAHGLIQLSANDHRYSIIFSTTW